MSSTFPQSVVEPFMSGADWDPVLKFIGEMRDNELTNLVLVWTGFIMRGIPILNIAGNFISIIQFFLKYFEWDDIKATEAFLLDPMNYPKDDDSAAYDKKWQEYT